MKSILKSVSLLLWMLFAFMANAQTIIYVTPSGAGSQNGTSWNNAYSGASLRSVLRNSAAYAQVWVAGGVYLPHPTSRDSSFAIRSNLKVYGGFEGAETSLAQRDWTANVTILSGDIGVANDTSDNSYHVVYFENAGDSTLLDGVTVTKGNAIKGPSYPVTLQKLGGGILNRALPGAGYSAPTIRHCIIRDNNALRGGGMYDMNDATIKTKIIDCDFTGNTVTETGAGYCHYLTNGTADVLLQDCNFLLNANDTNSASVIQARYGGAIAFMGTPSTVGGNTARMRIDHNVIQNNIASDGAGIYAQAGVYITVDSTTFKANACHGAFALIRSMSANMTIRNSIFEQHTVSNPYASGFLYWQQTSFGRRAASEVRNCVFRNNFPAASLYTIGAIAIRAGATAMGNAGIKAIDSTVIANCLFYNTHGSVCISNDAGPGGITNTALHNVTIYTPAGKVGGLAPAQVLNAASFTAGDPNGPSVSNMNINNSIVYYPPNWFGDAGFSLSLKNEVYGSQATANMIVRNSLVRSHTNAWPVNSGTNGGGNIFNTFPGFVDTAAGNFRLTCASPLIDMGNTTYLPAQFSDDLDHNPRIVNGMPDIGCYELPAQTIPLSVTWSKNGLNFTYAVGSSASIDSVRWNFGDNSYSNQFSGTHAYASAGTKQVCVTAYTDCGSQDTCFSVNICTNPAPAFNAVANAQHLVGFTYTGDVPVDSVRWDFGDGSYGSGLTASHQYNSADSFLVCVTASKGSCTNTFCRKIKSGGTTGIEQPGGEAGYINIYPNPASDKVTITATAGIRSVQVFQATGRSVLEKSFPGVKKADLPVTALAPGIYYLKIATGRGAQTYKLVKQ